MHFACRFFFLYLFIYFIWSRVVLKIITALIKSLRQCPAFEAYLLPYLMVRNGLAGSSRRSSNCWTVTQSIKLCHCKETNKYEQHKQDIIYFFWVGGVIHVTVRHKYNIPQFHSSYLGRTECIAVGICPVREIFFLVNSLISFCVNHKLQTQQVHFVAAF